MRRSAPGFAALLILVTLFAVITSAQEITPTPPETPVLIEVPNPIVTPLAPEIIPVNTEAPTPTPPFPATSLPYEVGTLPPAPTNLPTLNPTNAPIINSGNEGGLIAPFPSDSTFNSVTNYRLVPAGDVAGLYTAINDANMGLISTIYLNADRPFSFDNQPTADYVLPDRINIRGHVTIHANGAVLERTEYNDENGPYVNERGVGRGRIFYVAPGGTLMLHHVILRNTHIGLLPASFVGAGYGGAVLNEGSLNLFDSLILHNTAGPGGGGLMNFIGTANVYRVRFEDNFAGGGGAIQNDGDGHLFVECSQFVGNSAGYGGGVLNGGTFLDDGTILNDDSSMTIRYSAFSGNTSISNRGRDVFNLLPGIVTVDLSNNWWGVDGILPGDLTDDVEPAPVSFITTPQLSADPTIPDDTGSYAYAPCRPAQPAVIPIELALTLDIDAARMTAEQLADPYTFTIGEQIPLIARVAAEGVRDIAPTDMVRITLTVPRGLVPRGMTIQGEDQTILDFIFNLLAQFFALFGLPFQQQFDNGLAAAGDDAQITFTYDYDGGLVAGGQPLPITLDVTGEIVGAFTIEGEASVVAESLDLITVNQTESSTIQAVMESAFLQIQVNDFSNPVNCASLPVDTIVEQLSTTYHFMITRSDFILESEIRASCKAVINSANALRIFGDLVPGGPTYATGAAAFINVMLGSPQATITYSNTDDTSVVGASNCKTGPTTIVCGSSNILSEYTMTHELGHIFLYRSANAIPAVGTTAAPCPLSGSGVGFIGCMEDPNLPNADEYSNSVKSLRGPNSGTQFVFGTITRRLLPEQIQERIDDFDPSGQYGITSDFFPLIICSDFSLRPCGVNDDEPPIYAEIPDWERGVTGWDSPIEVSGPDRFGACDNASGDYEFTDFQQNPCVIYEWILEHPSATNEGDVGVLKTTEQEETGADMFLNWVYKTVEGNASQAFADNVSGNQEPTGRSFQGCTLTSSSGHGDDRFCWMQENLRLFFQYYGW